MQLILMLKNKCEEKDDFDTQLILILKNKCEKGMIWFNEKEIRNKKK